MKKPAAHAVEACQLLARLLQEQSQVFPEVSIGVNARLSDALVELGRNEEAQAPARQALAAAEAWKAGSPAVVAAQYKRLATALYRSGRLAEAEPLFRRALAILEAALGPQHPDVATSLNNLAVLLKDLGKHAEAEPLLRRTVAIMEATLGPQHPDVATALNNLADLLQRRGKFAEAEPLFRHAVAIAEAALGPQHPDVATLINNLAWLLKVRGKLVEVEPLVRRALVIREAALGPRHPDLARSLNDLALLLQTQGKLQEAEPLARRALAILEAALGPQHPSVSASLHNLALILHSRGKLADAESMLRRALAIREVALGPTNPDLAASINSLAFLLHSRGKLAEAESLQTRALAIREAALGPLHPDVATSLDNLALLLQARGKLLEAEPLVRRALAINEAALGPLHPDVAKSIQNLAGLLQSRGKLADAEPLYKRALAINEATLGLQHPDVATSLNNLAALLQNRGKLAEAEPLYTRALAIREAALGPLHPDVAISFDNLAVLSLSRGRPGAALDAFGRTVTIRESILRSSPSEDYAQALLQSWQHEQMLIFGLPLLLPQEPRALDLAVRAALLNKSRTQDVGALVNQALRSRLRTDAQRERYAQMQQLLADRAQLLSRPGGEDKRKQEQQLLWEAQRLNQALSQELGVASTQALPGTEGIREAVAAALPPDAALVEVVAAATVNWQARTEPERKESIRLHYLALALYRGGQTEAIDLGAPEDVHKAVGPLLAALRDPKEAIRDKAKNAYGAVFAKLDESLKRRGIRQLIISPEMALQLLPWQALHDGTQYLVDRYAIHYVAAGRDLLRKPSSVAAGTGLVLAAPLSPGERPLNQAKAVSITLSQQLGARLLLGGDATEERLSQAHSPFTLLLATHGRYRSPPAKQDPTEQSAQIAQVAQARESPLGPLHLGPMGARSMIPMQEPVPDLLNTEEAMHRSVLVLTPGRNPQDPHHDGLLTAEEVLGLRLQGTQLVTMLACEGGLGALEISQGVYGLRRAFLQAGAETVVSSLWSVDEPSASKLISLYYAKLQPGKKGRVEALDEAMKELRQDPEHPEYSHPHYWAPFVVLGMDGPLRAPPSVPVGGR